MFELKFELGVDNHQLSQEEVLVPRQERLADCKTGYLESVEEIAGATPEEMQLKLRNNSGQPKTTATLGGCFYQQSLRKNPSESG